MKTILKSSLFLSVFLMLLYSAHGTIDISTDRESYNLGSNIRVKIHIQRNGDLEGKFDMSLKCQNYDERIYLSPINLRKNFSVNITLPEFRVLENMTGSCSFSGKLVNYNNSPVEVGKSSGIIITDEMKIKLKNKVMHTYPGKEINISGELFFASGLVPKRAYVAANFNYIDYAKNATNGRFELNVKIPASMDSGWHSLTIIAADEFNNKANTSAKVYVEDDSALGEDYPTESKEEISASEKYEESSIDSEKTGLNDLNDITGKLSGADGLLARNTVVAPFVLVFIILGFVVYYSRNLLFKK